MEKKVLGTIKQVVGPVVDVQFKDQHLPELLTALVIPLGKDKQLTIEVVQHIGDDAVRCISMGPTEGLVRGMEVISLEHPISVPVGEKTLGRMFNVLGEPIDGLEPLTDTKRMSIHRQPPKLYHTLPPDAIGKSSHCVIFRSKAASFPIPSRPSFPAAPLRRT